jgi:hypothetical protein
MRVCSTEVSILKLHSIYDALKIAQRTQTLALSRKQSLFDSNFGLLVLKNFAEERLKLVQLPLRNCSLLSGFDHLLF